MLEALEREMPDSVTWNRPEGGYFLWIDFGPGSDAADLLLRATEAGVTFVRGADFFPAGGDGATSARLAFSFETPERIAEGVALLASLL
jgi:DNA-binding transcriptional MocR family regulator